MANRSDQDTTTIHLPDGRVLKGERTWFSIPDGAVWKRLPPPTEWRFTLDGEPIDQAQAEELAQQVIR